MKDMKTMKAVTVSLKDLKVNLFVRKALNQDHALYLAELLENGVVLPPISINADMEVVDGRHRVEAHELAGRGEIQASIVDISDEADMICAAYRANTGGSLPPTVEDTEHTVMLLIERGESSKSIGDKLGLPAGMARRLVKDVQSKTARAKLVRASEAVIEGGCTIAKAAEQHGVDPEKLREIMSGHRRKSNVNGVVEIQRSLTIQSRSVSIKNTAMLRNLFEKYEDADVSRVQVLAIINHIENLQKRSSRSIADWKKRFESIVK